MKKIVKFSLTVSLFAFLIILIYVFATPILQPPTGRGLQANATEVHRGEAFKIFANWNETVNASIIALNITAADTNILQEFIHNATQKPSEDIIINETWNNTWTNYTIVTNASWKPGNHLIRVNVTSTWESGPAAYNSTETNVTVLGWANTTTYLNKTFVELGEAVEVSCFVGDANTSEPLSNYYVEIYNETHNLTANFTNSDGWFNYTLVPQLMRRNEQAIKCAIYDNTTGYYTAAYNDTKLLKIGIPINRSTGVGKIANTLEAYAETYHSYYFNTSAVENSTTLVVELSWTNESKNIDLFLFNESGSYVDDVFYYPLKVGVGKGLVYNQYLPSNKIWEIRVYGNLTSQENYNLTIYLSTLNASTTFINFSSMNVTDQKNFVNLTLKNEGGLIFENVKQSRSIAHVNLTSSFGTREFIHFLPYSTSLAVLVKWVGESNYSLDVYGPNNEYYASVNKHINAKISNATLVESAFINQPSIGKWRIVVKNNTPVTDSYQLIVVSALNADYWINSNFTSQTFNSSFKENSTQNVHINFTVPNYARANQYFGFLEYYGRYPEEIKETPVLKIGFFVNVTSPELVVNNTFNSSKVKIVDNIGFNRTGENVIRLSIPINNTGNLNLTFDPSLSSNYLNSSTYYMPINFTHPIEIPAGGFGNLDINITIDTTKTGNNVGSYRGWIYLNAASAHPYQGFNLSLEVELTDKIKVNFLGINTSDGNNVKENAAIAENVTLLLEPYFANGTRIANLLPSNFTNIYLEEGNVSYRIEPISPVETSCTFSNEICKLNVTIPAGKPGGQYKVYLTTNYNTGSATLTNTTSSFPLIINNTGLRMELISYPSSLPNETSGIVNVSIKNYGPLNATQAKIKLTPGNLLNSNTTSVGSSCNSSFNSNEWTFNLTGYNPTGCWVAWQITAGQTNGTTTSTIAGTSAAWYWNLSFDTTITKSAEGIITPSPTYIANLEFIRAEQLITVQQNSTNSTIVEIKNTGNKTLNVTFSIENINTGWYTINATSKTLEPNKIAAFKVTFNIGSVEIGDYSGKYKASSPDKTITKDFTLRILPTEQKKKEINATLEEFKLNYTQLENEIDQAKARGINVTLAEKKLKELKSKIEEAENYIAKGDYLSAFNLFNTIKLLIGETKVELEKAKEAKAKAAPLAIPWNLIVPALIGIFVAVLLIYLFWPVKSGYKPEEKRFIKEGGIAPTVRLEEIKTKKESLLSWIVRKIKGKKEEVRIPEEKTVEEKWRELYEKYKKKAV
jgi:hypothetical protein